MIVQVCLEGEISRQSILNSLSRGKKASGDLIPWTVSEQVNCLGLVLKGFLPVALLFFSFLTHPYSFKTQSLAAFLVAE